MRTKRIAERAGRMYIILGGSTDGREAYANGIAGTITRSEGNMKPMIKCRYADKYKAKRAPKCGCDYCELKWTIAEHQRCLDDWRAQQFAGYPGYA